MNASTQPTTRRARPPSLLSDHPERLALNDEAHARPFEAVRPPTRASYIAYLNHSIGYEQELALMAELCASYDVAPPAAGRNHFSANLGAFRFKWARHSEFSSVTFIRHGEFRDPFGEPALLHVPESWLKQLPGDVLVAAHAGLEVQRLLPEKLEAVSTEYFKGNDLIGARIGDGSGAVYTDFRIHADGFSRYLLADIQMGPKQAGRMLQRLFEIDTYRMMASLALPLAKSLSPTLNDADRELAVLTAAMADARQEDEPQLLDRLTRLAAHIERLLSESDYRFSAARAYYGIVERRIGELREVRIQGMQPFREFMERRLAPAMNTCDSVERRQRMLADRVSRASAMLRARVDISLERQNQELLGSMDRRAKLQLRLQETVEGLSVAAITYYTVGLVGYAAKGLKTAGLHIEPELAMGLAIPVVALAVALGLRRMRKALAQEME